MRTPHGVCLLLSPAACPDAAGMVNTGIMSAALAPSPDEPKVKSPEPPWREFARAPLVPVALAATCGLVADRYADVPFGASVAVGLFGLVAWLVSHARAAE